MSDKIATLTDANWEAEVMKSEQPVLVDFWAEWCMPCRTLAPIVDAVAQQFEGKLKVGKINVDQHNLVATQYGVQSLPTLLLLKNGRVAEQRIGLVNKDALVKLVTPHLT
jgi:thioredoxin 1